MLSAPKNRKIFQIPFTIWILGGMSLLLNASSIMIFSLSPLYLTQVFGLAAVYLGILEGGVEFCSWTMRVFAGALSDYLSKRKPVLLFACALTVLARPIFAIASSAGWVYVAKLLDRIANGFQAPPREALVGDAAPSHLKGACYGLRLSLGVIGSLLGAIALMYLMRSTENNYTLIFWIASIPPLLALTALTLFVKDSSPTNLEEKIQEKKKDGYFKVFYQKASQLTSDYWSIIWITGVFMISNYSGAYRILQAQSTGFPIGDIALIMIAQNLGNMIAAFPVGKLSDKIDRRILLIFGFSMTVLANCCFGLASGTVSIILGSALWGVQMGITQSILSAMVADTAKKDLRGTAFGIYYFVIAFSLFAANTLMGVLSGRYGHTAGFMASAGIAAIGMILVFLVRTPYSKKKLLKP
ncbi:MAG: MFS transporter [Rhabdochlamydiaceae bacterium]|nr:MFS transporter [Rhabdochlamydiaceae bacterium]